MLLFPLYTTQDGKKRFFFPVIKLAACDERCKAVPSAVFLWYTQHRWDLQSGIYNTSQKKKLSTWQQNYPAQAKQRSEGFIRATFAASGYGRAGLCCWKGQGTPEARGKPQVQEHHSKRRD